MPTRINTAGVVPERTGSVLVPNVEMYCPRCGMPAEDMGQCSVELRSVPSESSCTGFEMQLLVNCRGCQAEDLPPAFNFNQPFEKQRPG